jgi:dipeptidyl aminopeptidase/acylaminoacyl peptidase
MVFSQKLGQYEVIDQVAGANYLKTLEYVDPDKVGIWGWSFGGYMTLSCLANTTTFAYGISVAPVTDWKFYGTCESKFVVTFVDSVYTERFMLTPQQNPVGYAQGSVLNHATQIENGKLLLIHGTGDDNVHFQNTAELVKVSLYQSRSYILEILFQYCTKLW